MILSFPIPILSLSFYSALQKNTHNMSQHLYIYPARVPEGSLDYRSYFDSFLKFIFYVPIGYHQNFRKSKCQSWLWIYLE